MLTETINAFFDSLGAEWILWLLLLLSVLSIGIMVERWLFFRRNFVAIDPLSASLMASLHERDAAKARATASGVPGMTGAVLNATFEAHEAGVEDIGEVISATLARERSRYDRNLAILGTLGNNAPFIGLLGTVIGIINAFAQLAGALDGSARTEAVMHSISEALVATAVGLAVAIPAVIAFNAFKTRIKKLVSDNEWLARHTLAYLQVGSSEDGNA
jgi:biopolymer transport protein ExbB